MRVWMVILAAGLLLALLPGGGATGAGTTQKVTITMRDFGYSPDKVTLRAGLKARITLVNTGRVKHEFMVYDPPKGMMKGGEMHDWAESRSYFKGVELEVEGGGIAVAGEEIFEVEVGPGRSAELTFTPKKTGTFEMGCMLEDHYERGQKGVLVVK